ncbi:putative WD repeat-containing protein [Colletotrichum siamense]|uniref:WD repeat-containing protein n=1 Tax=Colletotrichum siamense TaxID=690259 RepID=A0A9P5K7X8_COLSI|nr:putative WD repeat-containing protein [Colletotrichum siamense]KAF4864161.1 putative WD repeat-containing protein [Colletotrichum siamense]KAI8180907.1 putative WD repeat-containing protein [Colletotrichum sp. SAR 10_65]KAI8234632.1 putative WD repeat-containing protein [Colletotrichum sp. SAR 10_86]
MSDEDDFVVEGPELAEDDPMRAFLPASFGKKSKEANIAAQIDRSRRTTEKASAGGSKEGSAGPPKTEQTEKKPGSDSDSDSDSNSDSDDSDDGDDYPVSHELVLKTHERAVTTVTLDPAGGRLVSASLDCKINLHDFASMTPSTLRAFRTVDPWETKASAASAESHPIHHVEFNHLSGSAFLCVSAHPQAKIMSRDGDILTEFVKGDMYLRDMNNTKGHISEVTTGTWHPADKNLCITAGTDSTLRIWDVNNKRSQRDVIVFKSKAAGSAGRTRMTAVAWGSPVQGGNNVLVAAALDGSLVMYSGNSPFSRPTAEIRDAHKPDTWTGGIDISSDGRMVVTRGGDNTIKLWDTRKFKTPLVTVDHASTSDHFPMSNIRYSPNSTSILTGSANGDLHILNPGNLRPEHVTPITPGAPLITVDWHPKINQIVTGSANGETHVLYNPTMSTRGAVEVMSRAPKKRHIDDDPSRTTDMSVGMSGDSIVTPGGAMAGRRTGGVTASGKSRDPRRPAVLEQTPFMRNQPDEKHIAENIPLAKMLHEDPREALLKYAEAANKDPMFTAAWQKTQPVTQYANLSDEEEGPEKKKAKR